MLIIFMKVFLCQLDIERLIGFSFLGFILLFLLPFEHEESKENGKTSCLDKMLGILIAVKLILGNTIIYQLDDMSS